MLAQRHPTGRQTGNPSPWMLVDGSNPSPVSPASTAPSNLVVLHSGQSARLLVDMRRLSPQGPYDLVLVFPGVDRARSGPNRYTRVHFLAEDNRAALRVRPPAQGICGQFSVVLVDPALVCGRFEIRIDVVDGPLVFDPVVQGQVRRGGRGVQLTEFLGLAL